MCCSTSEYEEEESSPSWTHHPTNKLEWQPFEDFTEPTSLGSRESLLTIPIATPILNGATDKLFEVPTAEQLESLEIKRQIDYEMDLLKAEVEAYERECKQ